MIDVPCIGNKLTCSSRDGKPMRKINIFLLFDALIDMWVVVARSLHLRYIFLPMPNMG